MGSNKTQLGERIKMIRKSAGLTQEKFAIKLGLKRNSVANYEIGRNIPLEAIQNSICREFNINKKWLMTGDGEMYSSSTDDLMIAIDDIEKNDPKARQVIMDYWKLPPSDKELFWKFIDKFIKM